MSGGIVGQSHLYTPLTTTHSRVWHYLLRPAVSYEWIVFNWGNSGYICEYWALQANWMFSEKMPLKKPCELFLFCSCDCVGGLFRCKNMSGPQPLIGIKELGLLKTLLTIIQQQELLNTGTKCQWGYPVFVIIDSFHLFISLENTFQWLWTLSFLFF